MVESLLYFCLRKYSITRNSSHSNIKCFFLSIINMFFYITGVRFWDTDIYRFCCSLLVYEEYGRRFINAKCSGHYIYSRVFL